MVRKIQRTLHTKLILSHKIETKFIKILKKVALEKQIGL